MRTGDVLPPIVSCSWDPPKERFYLIEHLRVPDGVEESLECRTFYYDSIMQQSGGADTMSPEPENGTAIGGLSFKRGFIVPCLQASPTMQSMAFSVLTLLMLRKPFEGQSTVCAFDLMSFREPAIIKTLDWFAPVRLSTVADHRRALHFGMNEWVITR